MSTMQYSYDLFVRELGAKLKQMRKDRGWTLRNMVIDHRLHMTQWQRLESGKGTSMPSLLRICEVFDVGLSQLVGELGQVDREAEPKAELVMSAVTADPLPTLAAQISKKPGTRRRN